MANRVRNHLYRALINQEHEVGLHEEPADDDDFCSTQQEHVPRLSDMVCHCITRRADLTSGAIKYLPPKFVPMLLKCAVDKMSYESAKLLLQHYKGDVLSLHGLGVGHSNKDLNRTSTAMVRAFFESLEARIPLLIKTLDISGFPISGPGLSYLTVQAILAYTESQKSKVLRVVEQAKGKGRISEEQANPFGDLQEASTIPPGHYTVLLDCCVSDESMVRNLSQALKISQWADDNLAGPFVRLGICRIQFGELYFQHMQMLLELISPEYLHGLTLHFCHMVADVNEIVPDDSWTLFARSLERFPDLDSLELNGLGLTLEGEDEQALRLLLEQLQRLERLSLFMSRIPSGRLRFILGACRRPLKFLNLQACDISALDLMWLSGSQAAAHTSSLEDLNLAENVVVSEELTTTCCLIKACRKNLRKLHLSFCNLQDRHLERLVANIVMVNNLKFLDLRFNIFENPSLVCEKFRPLASHPSLEKIILSFPRLFVAFEERGIFETQFKTDFEKMFNEHKFHLRRHPISVIFW